jgi:hypothetical protein
MADCSPSHETIPHHATEKIPASDSLSFRAAPYVSVVMQRKMVWIALGVFSLQAIVLGISLAQVFASPNSTTPDASLPLAKWFSLAQLISTGLLSCCVAVHRSFRNEDRRRWPFWLLIGLGFLYLAGESVWRVNERIETRIEKLAHLSDESWSRGIDDMLLMLAGMVGVGVLAYYWRELASLRRARSLYAAGFAVLFLMSFWDLTMGQRMTIASALGIPPATLGTTPFAYSMLELFEDALMLMGEGLFLMASCDCLACNEPGSAGVGAT